MMVSFKRMDSGVSLGGRAECVDGGSIYIRWEKDGDGWGGGLSVPSFNQPQGVIVQGQPRRFGGYLRK